MITAYHRPQTLEEALELLQRAEARPLGGGTLLSQATPEAIEVVDLQALELNDIQKSGNTLSVGATSTLQELHDHELCPPALQTAIKLEATLNLRNAATVAGTIMAADGRSPFVTLLLALDTKLTVVSHTAEEKSLSLGELLSTRNDFRGQLITKMDIPAQAQSAFESVSRTPSDKPILCIALAQWNSGRTRLTVGGFGKTPSLAMDGTESDGAETAARNACHESGDEWASAAYRMDIAAKLANRALNQLNPDSSATS